MACLFPLSTGHTTKFSSNFIHPEAMTIQKPVQFQKLKIEEILKIYIRRNKALILTPLGYSSNIGNCAVIVIKSFCLLILITVIWQIAMPLHFCRITSKRVDLCYLSMNFQGTQAFVGQIWAIFLGVRKITSLIQVNIGKIIFSWWLRVSIFINILTGMAEFLTQLK